MKRQLWITLVAAIIAVTIGSTDFAFGRGGRGGGGGFGGGGARGGGGFGGGARPSGGFSGGGGRSFGSSPSFSRPTGGAARPSMPSTRPSTGATSRPNFGGGNVGAGNRPNIGAGAGSRPSTLPANRAGIGSGKGIGSGQGIGAGQGIANRPGAGQGITNRPGVGAGQGIANRPGASQLPARLPGLGEAGAGSRLPNQGANRPQTLEGRRGDLNNRMSSGREDWQNHRQDMQGNRQDFRSNNREDWQNWADGNIHNHGDWYHGCWHGGWYPGAGWGHMWNNYPVATAFGLTAWGVNRVAYGWGYWGYDNPYATTTSVSNYYDYSQPIAVSSDSGNSTTPVDPAATPAATSSDSDDEAKLALDQARAAFYDGDSAKALTLLDTAIKATPNDTVVHEFRGLVLFSLKKYPESAAATYAVLSAGPGWNWTTMIGLYPSVDVYTKQLRALEEFAKANPKSPDAHFLLGYQYLTSGYAEVASKQFKLAQSELPNDKLVAQLVGMTTPPPPDDSEKTATPPAPEEVPAEKVLSADKLVGNWKASNQDAEFQLELAKDGSFVWTYSRGKTKQTMKGVFAVDQNNLALEPESGGTMLAEIDFANPSQFLFKMIGGDAKDPGLDFKKG